MDILSSVSEMTTIILYTGRITVNDQNAVKSKYNTGVKYHVKTHFIYEKKL
jgi:hypothetical protein